uniref:Kinesin motor domain-containing protein n=1 Tax=Fagus sylvatica TaxID=28930 RepID=A0A2N9J1B2_FAGSY
MGTSGLALEVKVIGGSKNTQELERLETVSENSRTCRSLILVFVRLRPLAKEEKEAGLPCCVRILNQQDVYMTEFANKNDYLRLKRLHGRHFTFDASFQTMLLNMSIIAYYREL